MRIRDLERQLAARADGAPRPLARGQRGRRHRAPGTEARRRALPARGIEALGLTPPATARRPTTASRSSRARAAHGRRAWASRRQRPAAARHRGDIGPRAPRQRLRAEWPGGRFREIHATSSPGSSGCAPTSAALLAQHEHAAGRRRLQHRAGGSRRARPGGLGGLGPRERARARGAREDRRARSRTSSASSSSPRNPGAGGTTA